MTFSSIITAFTLAILSQNVNCKSTEIDFIIDIIHHYLSDSITVVAFLCWNLVDKYKMMNKMFENQISGNVFDVNSTIKEMNPSTNRLYVLDLDCSNSDILFQANEKKLFAEPYKWLILTKNKNYITETEKHFLKYDFLVDNQIILAYKSSENEFILLEMFKFHKNSNNIQKRNINNWIAGKGFQKMIFNFLPSSRKNLQRTLFKTTVVVLNNDTYNHLEDYRFKHIDSISKVNFVLTHHLIDFVNGSKHFKYANSWGYYNASSKRYDGMIGDLQKDESEIGGTALFMTGDRIPIIEYLSMTVPTKAMFVFRQPPLSYVTNVFTLPFSGDVWLSSLILCILSSFLLYIAVSVEWRQTNKNESENQYNGITPSFLDSVMVTIGAVAQQGASQEPKNGSGRIVMLFVFTALMFLYVSYSANIVALLQSSATNIRTLDDLLNSRLVLGVEDIIYNRYYFETATEPTRKAIYEQKVAPKGQKSNFMKLNTGIAKIREGFFAFHAEVGAVYKLIADTFYENEKCGLRGIEYLQLVYPHYAIKKNSSYKQLLAIGLRLIRETGIQSREVQRLYTKKPDCHSSGANFVSVGLIDAYAAFLVLGVGMGLSIILFLLEKIVDARIKFIWKHN